MIEAMIFDLDGTLVQSEKLKARSYAIAVQRLRGLAAPDPQAIEAYREIVGASRDVASKHVIDRLGLVDDLRPLLDEYGVSEPWEVLTVMRKTIYDATRGRPAGNQGQPVAPQRRATRGRAGDKLQDRACDDVVPQGGGSRPAIVGPGPAAERGAHP